MAGQFIGYNILVQLSNGSAIEGTLSAIDVAGGTLTITDAVQHRDGYESTRINSQVVQRSQVKDLQVLQVHPNASAGVKDTAPQLSPTSIHQQYLPPVQPTVNSVQLGQLQQIPPQMDPAILSVGRQASGSNASSRTTQSAIGKPNLNALARGGVHIAPASVRPAPSSLASSSTIAAFSTVSAPQSIGQQLQNTNGGRSNPRMPSPAAKERSNLAKATMKKKQNQINPVLPLRQELTFAGRRFGGAETAGSEADESHVANSEAPVIRRRVTNSSLRPRQQYMTTIQPDDTEADEPHDVPGNSLDDDFDFSRGLASFNKQRVFREIRDADTTDPAARLVAHNKRTEYNPYTTKLRYNENVLDAHDDQGLPDGGYKTVQHAIVTRIQPNTISVGVDAPLQNEQTASDDGGPVRMRSLATTATSSLDSLLGANHPQDLYVANGHQLQQNGTKPFRRQMVTTDGLPVSPVIDKQWKEIIQLCNIECGPNLQQRVENAARGIATILWGQLSTGNPVVTILCTPCNKGNIGLRAGAHLLNHGAACIAFIPQSDQQMGQQHEFYLRLFSAAGGKIVRTAQELPTASDIIIDALTDNETNIKKGKAQDFYIPDAISWALSCTTKIGSNTQAPLWSVELPSNTNPDTGTANAGAIWQVTPRAVIALGLVRAAAVDAQYTLHVVDIGIPPAAIERGGMKGYQRIFKRGTYTTTIL